MASKGAGAASRPRATPRSRLPITVAATIGGVALLAWQIDALGPASIIGLLTNVGLPGFAAILAVSGVRLTLRALAWRAMIADPPPLRRALAATISGDAIGNLTPLSLLASEPAKAMYLGGRADAARVFAALAAENFFYSVSVAIYVIAGTAALLLSFGNLPPEIRATGVVILAGMSAVLIGAAWLAWRRPRLLTSLVSRLAWPPAQRFAGRLHEFEVRVYGVAGHPESRLGRLFACETAFHVFSFAEVWLTLWLLTGSAHPLQVFILDTVNRVVNVAFRFVPLRVGVDEVTAESVARAVGLADAVGVATALVRKMRVAFWSLVGLTLLTRRGLGSSRTQ
jgi:hypothetical protein